MDTQIFRKNVECNPLPTFHYAQSQDLTFTLVVDVEVASSFISLDIVDILRLNVSKHPSPYYLEGYHPILFQCRLPFRVEQYENKLLFDVTTIKSVGIILGHEWIANRQIRYSRLRKMFIYPWMKKAAPHQESQPPPEPRLEPLPPPLELHPELLPEIIVEPELNPNPELDSDLVHEPEIDSKPEAVIKVEPVPEPEPELEHDYIVESELVSDSLPEELELDPDLVLEPELETNFVAEPEPVTESDLPLQSSRAKLEDEFFPTRGE